MCHKVDKRWDWEKNSEKGASGERIKNSGGGSILIAEDRIAWKERGYSPIRTSDDDDDDDDDLHIMTRISIIT